jgi:hypothetical protein
MGMRDPQGECIRSAIGQDDVTGKRFGDGVENIGAIDGFRPGLGVFQAHSTPLQIVGGRFPTAGVDFGIEGGGADAEASGFGVAAAIEFGFGQTGEASEAIVVGFGCGLRLGLRGNDWVVHGIGWN